MNDMNGVAHPTSISSALAKQARGKETTKVGTGQKPTRPRRVIRKEDVDNIIKDMREKYNGRVLADIQEGVEREMLSQFDDQVEYIDGSSIGCNRSQFRGYVQEDDPVQSLLQNVQDIANGYLGGVGQLVGGSTMDVVHGIANGTIDTEGEIVDGILGNGSEELAKSMMEVQERGLLSDAVGAVANTAAGAAQAISQTASAAANMATSTISQAASIGSQALGQAAATASGVASSAMQTLTNTASSMASSAVGLASSVASTALDAASGAVGGAVDAVTDAVGGAADAAASLAQDAANALQDAVGGAADAASNAVDKAASAISNAMTISLKVPAPKVCAAVTSAVSGALETATDAMKNGLAKLKSLNSAVGGLNGAKDLLTATLQGAIDKKVAKLMSKIVSHIKTAHGITHPMFMAIFKMTWSENQQWVPGFSGLGDGSKISKFLKPLKEIPEYFDFIQKIIGGAIAEICKNCDKLFTDVIAAAKGLAGLSIKTSLKVKIPKPDLSIPLMSISKQIEDVFNKIMVIKDIIRQKAKQILQKLKSLQAPELYINLPGEFLLILEVLIEAEFIYANLPIVLDKILEYILNLLIAKFAEIAEKLINKILKVWKKVCQIVPPLEDLLMLCWAIPNKADFCVNIALNIAIPQMWSIIQPYVDLPFQCIDMVSQACD